MPAALHGFGLLEFLLSFFFLTEFYSATQADLELTLKLRLAPPEWNYGRE